MPASVRTVAPNAHNRATSPGTSAVRVSAGSVSLGIATTVPGCSDIGGWSDPFGDRLELILPPFQPGRKELCDPLDWQKRVSIVSQSFLPTMSLVGRPFLQSLSRHYQVAA